MPRMLGLVIAAGLLGCSALYREEPCGRQRSLAVDDTLPTLTIHLSLIDEEDRPDGFSWEIIIPGRSDITAVHLHDATPGNGDRILYDLTTEDLNPFEPGVTVAGGGFYSFDADIKSLFGLVQSGNTYIDVHTGAPTDADVRADLTDVQFEDWSGYYCS